MTVWSQVHKYYTYIIGATVLELKFLEMPVGLSQRGTLALSPRVATDRTESETTLKKAIKRTQPVSEATCLYPSVLCFCALMAQGNVIPQTSVIKLD